jgi:3-oxoacyl-[acyl-carrier protein] reductase
MTDRYLQFANSGLGKMLVSRLGLPSPTPLRRYQPGQPVVEGPVLLGGAPGGRLGDPVTSVLKAVQAEVRTEAGTDTTERHAAVIFDATGIDGSERLAELYEFLHPVIRGLRPCGRVLVLGTPPEDCAERRQAVAQRALEGFVRSVGKELKRGGTAQLVYVAPGAEHGIESTLRFLLSAKSAFVSGQVVRIGAAEVAEPADWEKPLTGNVAVVTGASRGIGAAIAEVLGRDGAHVVCLDVPAQEAELAQVAERVGGETLLLDVTAQDAPDTLVDELTKRHGGVDVVVHNAGITRDKTLGRMSRAQWDAVLAVNLTSQERINERLLSSGVLRTGGRLVTVSSIGGIAGNVGQTNYGASKAGVIGTVQTLAPTMAEHGQTINAVAPGFIETAMTAAMPAVTREFGRRLASLSQGGLPVDVAETIAWYANPASTGVNGNVVRVCGQSLLGA